MAGLIHERAAIEFPGAAPRRLIVVVLRTGPEDVDVDHINAAETTPDARALQALQGRVETVLLDHEQMHTLLVAGGDHALAINETRRHRLLGHHVATGAGNLYRVLRMQAAGGAQHQHIGLRVFQQFVDRGVTRHAVLGSAGLSKRGIDIAHRHQLGPLAVDCEGLEVTIGDAAAADHREANGPVIDDVRCSVFHRFMLDYAPTALDSVPRAAGQGDLAWL